MPKRSPVPPEVLDRWKELQATGCNIATIGGTLVNEFPDLFVMPDGSAMLARSAYMKCHREANEPDIAQAQRKAVELMPEPQRLPDLLQPLVVPYKDTLVIADAHIPFHYEELFADALLFAKANKLRRVSLMGDFLDFLFFSAYENLAREKLEETWLVAARALEAMFDHGLQEVLWCAGNHEHRYERKSGAPVASILAYVVDRGIGIAPGLGNAIKKRVRMTNMFWMRFTDTPDGIDWMLDHQWNHRRVRGSTASDLALVTNECHTMTGHEHHYSLQLAQNSRYYAVCVPTMQNPHSAEYMVRRKRAGSRQCEGFGWLIDGCPGLWSMRDPEQAKIRRLKGKAVL